MLEKRGNEASKMGDRIFLFDFLRALAILIILFVHFPNYTFDYFLLLNSFGLEYIGQSLHFLLSAFGVGLFVLISGYLAAMKSPFKKKGDSLSFLKRRFTRVFPLYWLALLVFYIGYQVIGQKPIFGSSPEQVLFEVMVHIPGMQIMIGPPTIVPVFTLWFVGLIVFLYLLFPVIQRFEDRLGRFIIATSIVFIFFIILSESLNIIDVRFFLYYPLFILGISLAKFFPEYVNRLNWSHLFFAFILTITLTMAYYCLYGEDSFSLSIIDAKLCFLIVLMTVYSICILQLTNLIRRSNISILSNSILKKGMIFISFSSFCLYLFHRPFFEAVSMFRQQLEVQGEVMIALIFIASLPLLFAFSFFLQKSYDKMIRRLSNRN